MYTLAVIMMACLFVHKRIDTVVTYADIRAKRAEILKAKQEYIQRLRDTATRLVNAYESSLALPELQWRDIEGELHPYVYICFNGFSVRPEDLQVDLRDGVAFKLYTVVDDNPRQSASMEVGVKIVLLDGDNLTISVNGYGDRTFSHVDTDAKINEVCEFIKDSILMSMNDVNLAKHLCRR
ncbi:hypothetical protein NKK66_RS25745 [Escherichia coli]|uniref:hypothetical protein n=1 Tax=Escherichia TaxID=561 RepID=UPI0002074E63|nr:MULTISPECIES: hypothetical protein [Escherichia]EGE65431.1 hypothetical protein ECSTEC7V_1231 [Escherichia coli STEC_7v]MEB6433319.1 hypothetical protein [Escherichia coli]OTB66335.1 hypothetical protein AW065_06395 [Escherichia coli]OTC18577.1 hypothetical protein AW073_25435 [Escherichia coli]OTE54452.1 hypothetical protein AW118_26435 [Escherichia coli]